MGWFLFKIGFPILPILYGMLFFLCAPWATQPVLCWWASFYLWHTFLFLVACFFYLKLRAETKKNKKCIYVLGFVTCIFFSLLFAELWLFGFVTIIGVELYLSSFKDLFNRDKIKNYVIILLPYLFWFSLYKITFVPEEVYQVKTDVLRAFIVFFSVHLRTYHWFENTPWINAISQIKNVLSQSFAMPLLFISLGSIILLFLMLRSSKNHLLAPSAPLDKRQCLNHFYKGLFLAWTFFAGSRLVFILQGGVTLHTRHSYGAAIAAGVLVCVVVNYLLQTRHRYLRPVLIGLTLTLTLMAITTAGLAYHSASTARAEKYTWERLSKELNLSDADRQIVITGNPTGTRGELPYFEEDNGGWLEVLLQRSLGTHFDVFVAPSATLQGNTLIATTYSGKTERISLKNTIWYAWEGKELVRKQY
jgi:hypothetical protein